MVIVKIDDIIIEFPSEFEELTVGQLDRISFLLESKEPETIQWLNVISYLSGLSIEEVEEWPYESFIDIALNMFKKLPEVERAHSFTHDGIEYHDTGNNSLSVRQTWAIEQLFTDDTNENRMSSILAIVFSNSSMSKSDNLKSDNIKAKAELIAQLPLKQFIPQILIYGVEFVTNIKNSISNDESSTVTRDITTK